MVDAIQSSLLLFCDPWDEFVKLNYCARQEQNIVSKAANRTNVRRSISATEGENLKEKEIKVEGKVVIFREKSQNNVGMKWNILREEPRCHEREVVIF